MLDIRLIRTEPEAVKDAIHKRELDYDGVIDKIIELDEARRVLTGEIDTLKAAQNTEATSARP